MFGPQPEQGRSISGYMCLEGDELKPKTFDELMVEAKDGNSDRIQETRRHYDPGIAQLLAPIVS
jgi:hypothetical protein